MKAIIWTRYGPPDVLQLREVEKPVPKDNEVLIRIRAATVTAGDCELRSLKFASWLALPMRLYVGLRRPKRIRILGQELAGDVEAAGRAVKSFKAGDKVFATTGFTLSAYAEYICLREGNRRPLAIMPANMTYEEAAAVPVGGLEALHFLRNANIRRGEKVLINGAGGSIGTFAIQLALHFGAEVTGVDSSGKLDMLRTVGAHHVVDYTQEDFSRRGERYDVVFDVVGKRSFARSMNALKPHGRYLMANPTLPAIAGARWRSLTGSKQVVRGPASQTREDLNFLRELIEAGKIRSVIDRRYPLEQTAEAHRYVETGRKKGNVVIVVP